jgi:hypothetical protein
LFSELPFPAVSEALPRLRLAEPFEVLRDAVDKMKASPKVFLANLGKPIHITALGVQNHGAAGGTVGHGWSDGAQADWNVVTLENILSKPYVDSVTLHALGDGQAGGIVGGGLLRDDGSVKPLWQKLLQLRGALQGGKK